MLESEITSQYSGDDLHILIDKLRRCVLHVYLYQLYAQVVASQLQACRLVACVCSNGFMVRNLLQVVKRLDEIRLSKRFIHKLDASCRNNLHQVCKQQVASGMICTD